MEFTHQKNAGIERLRGFAVLLVMLTHMRPDFLPAIFRQGWGGVDLFFVISGFVITSSLLRALPEGVEGRTIIERIGLHREVILDFFTRRFFRIMPLAVLVAVLAWPVFLYTGEHVTLKSLVRETLGLMSGAYNYTLAAGLHSKAYSVYWSLAVEEHFYLLFPFLLLAFASPQKRILGAAATVAFIAFVVRPFSLSGIADAPWYEWRAATHLRIDAIAAGVLIALIRQQGWGSAFTADSRLVRMGALAAALCVAALPSIVNGQAFPHLLTSLWAASAVLVFLSSTNERHVFSMPVFSGVLAYMGSRSYALYLVHSVIIAPVKYFYRESGPGGVEPFAITVGLSFVFAELLYRFVEQPCIRLGRKRIAARSAARQAGEPAPVQRAS